MRWWRRNDGFEWKDYVRTTVLVRRQHRRDKIEAAKVAAIDGVKEAGRKGIAVGAAGAEAAGQAAVKIAKSAAAGAAGGADKGLALFVRGAGAARSRIASASEPVNTRLMSPRVSLTLAVVAAVAGAGFGVRAWQFGADWDAVLLGAVAVIAGMAWLWPRLFSNTPEAEDEWASRTERAVGVVDRTGSALPVAGAAVFAVIGIWFAAPVISRWFANAASSPERTRVASAPVSDNTVEGAARVVGPGLLRIRGTLVRLEGIVLLDPGQSCRRADGTTWACGAAAKQALEKLARSRRTVTCSLSGETDDGRFGTCSSDGKDLAAELVRAGLAFSKGALWATYAAQQAEAQEAKAGLWAGEAEQPDAWRDRLYSEAAALAPGGCPIKGRVQSGRRLYVLPYAADYGRIAIREDRGERWFCSAEDAQAAGFRARDTSR